MTNFDDVTNANETEHNPNWPHNLDYPCRILTFRGSGSGKKPVTKSNKLSTRY